MQKIKICYVIVNCKITGPMNQTLNIIKNLNKDKFEVSIITLFEEEENNSMLDSFLNEIKSHYCLHLNKLKSIIFGKIVLKKVLDKLKPNIVHGLGMPPYRLSLVYKETKHLVTLRNYAYEDYPSYYNKVLGYPLALLDINLIKRKLKKGETFVTCSKSLSNIYFEKEKVNIPYIRNGVDIQKFKLKSKDDIEIFRKKWNIPLNKIVMIYTAPFNKRKNQEEVIKAFLNIKKKINNIFLILCGDGDLLEVLEKKYPDNDIRFTGKIKNVSEYLRLSDIYVSSSKSEGLPNSVLEALSSGLPVVLSNIPQHNELLEIDNTIGFTYEIGNIEDFSLKIEKVIKEKYFEKFNNYFKFIENNLSSKVMSKNYENLYISMMNRENSDTEE